MEYTTVKLPYNLNREYVEVSIPKDCLASYSPAKTVEKPLNLKEVVARHIKVPVGTSSLKKLCSKARRVTVLVDDHTRPTPAKPILEVLFRELKLGNEGKEVKLVIARGSHEKPPDRYLKAKVGEELLELVELHDCYNDEVHEFVGITSYATPVWVNKELAKADFSVGVGCIFPAPSVGFSGGCKIVLPGVSHIETINRNHSLFLSPRAKCGVIKGNPAREDIDEAGLMSGLTAIVNVVLDADCKLAGVFVGHPVKAHRRGVVLSRKLHTVKASKADVVIASPGGYEDIDFVQATKAFFNLNDLCNPGGCMVLVAACPLGMDWPEFSSFVAKVREEGLSKSEILKMALRGEVETIAADIVYRMYDVFVEERKKFVFVSSNVPKNLMEKMGVEVVKDVDEALEIAFSRTGKKAKITVLPHAALCCVKII